MYRVAAIVAALLVSSAAQAHVGVGDINGFGHGFAHPMSGIDHVLAMVAVGLYAAHLGGRALWLVPTSFVLMMVVGGVLGMIGVPLPFVEVGIGLSVVVLGVAIAAGFDLPTAAAMILVGVFAIFHGHAHGAEMPDSLSGTAYGAGFVLATAALHTVGIVLALLIGKMQQVTGRRLLRTAGGAMAIAGMAILAGYA
jgi:urease accessory protein